MAPNTDMKSYLQQQNAIAAAAAAAALSASSSSYQGKKQHSDKHKWLQQASRVNGPSASSQLPPPVEVTRCYDEIDQIYDYIRGLAPLPDNLKSMKSIDFEKIEQRERLKRQQQQQQQQQLLQEQKNVNAATTTTTAAAVTTVATVDKFLQLDQSGSGRKMAKLRQREVARAGDDASGGELPLGPPQVSQFHASKRHPQQQQLIVPLPIRVTTTTSESRRPTIKRVESFNLQDNSDRLAAPPSQQQHHEASLQWRQPQHLTTKISSLKHQVQGPTPSASSKPNYLISATQRGQQFRLPRAHSNSTLGKQRLAQLAAQSDDATSKAANEKVKAYGRHESSRSQQRHSEQQQPLASIVCSDLVESFVDDDADENGDHAEQDSGDSSSSASDDDGDRSRPTTTTASDSSTSSGTSESIYENKSHTSRSIDTSNTHKEPMCSSAAKSKPHLRDRSAAVGGGKKIDEEHIYEQIPAHASSAERHHLIARGSIAAAETTAAANNRSMFDLKLRTSDAPSGPRAATPKINYPVAYSANVAANARYQQQVAALFACQQRQTNQRRAHHQRQQQTHRRHVPMPISQFSPPALSLNRTTIVRATSNMSQQQQQQQQQQRSQFQTATMPRALVDVAHHHRLSMGNLHMLPATATAAGIPLASLHNKRTAAAVAPPLAVYHSSTLDKLGSLGRSSSSSRVNRLGARPPKLSPAELIARIQMPRAASKRQVVASKQQTTSALNQCPIGFDQAADGGRQQSITYGAYVWQQPAMRASVKNVPQDKQREASRHQQQQQLAIGSASSNSNRLKSPLASKRASIRRLTAIGIEQAFALVRQRPIAASSAEVARGYLDSSRQLVVGGAPPLIVDANQDDGPVSISAESQSSSSSEANSSDHTSDRGNHLLAAVGASANRCLDSISDLHSFSSSSSTTTSRSSADMSSSSEPSESSQSAESASDGSRPRVAGPAGKVLAGAPSHSQTTSSLSNNNNNNKGDNIDANFVSSQSFVKCYYGRNGDDAELADEKLLARAAPAASATVTSKQKSKPKRLGSKLFSNGERLLSLIGLDTIGKSGGGDKSALLDSREKVDSSLASSPLSLSSARKVSSSQQRAKLLSRRTSAPPTPSAINSIVASGTIVNNRQSAASSRRRFSSLGVNNSASGQLVTNTPTGVAGTSAHNSMTTTAAATTTTALALDSASGRRRASAIGVAAARPTQPAPRLKNATSICHFEHPLVEIAKVPDRSEQQAKVKRTKASNRHASSASKNPVEQQEAGSSGTTNSTSSYEAAIKNSAERAPRPSAADDKESAAEQNSHNTTSSHQLQATSSTLIKVPKLSKQSHLLNRPLPKLPAGSGGGRPSVQLNNAPARLMSDSGASLRTNQRNSGGINLQHVASAIVDRYGTNRSDPSSGAHNRVASRYLLTQQQLRAKPANLVAASGGVASVKSKQSPMNYASQSQQPLVSTNLDAAEPTRTTQAPEIASTKQRQRQQVSTSSSTGLKSPSATSNNQLSSLGTIHASPTVTTYTSSGISSTHLATNTSSSSSQRSKASASSNRALAPITSSSSNQKRATPGLCSLEGGPSSWHQQSSHDRSDDDDDEENVGDLGDDIDMIDEQGNSISPDIMRFGCGEGEGARRGHLKSFDERFSSKYVDQHLASSDDSLLESINFSGTLGSSRKKRQQLPAMTTSKR